MQLNTIHLFVSTIVAAGGLALGVYQAVKSSDPPKAVTQPVQVQLSLEQKPAAAANQPPALPGSIQEAAGAELAKPPATPSRAPGKSVQTVKVDSSKLLGNMRSSLAVVAKAYAEAGSHKEARQSSKLVLASVKEVALSIDELERSVATKQPKQVSRNTARLSRSIGKLQTAYAVVPQRSPGSDRGMKALNANWSAYSSRYALAAPAAKSKTASPNSREVKALRKQTAELQARIAKLEKQTAKVPALQRQLSQARAELRLQEQRNDAAAYQGLLLTLAVVDGVVDMLADASRDYYPEYYAYFEPVRREDAFWEGYWSGYYDGYYDRPDWVWFDDPVIYEPPQVWIDDPQVYAIATVETVTTTEIVNTVETTEQVFSALPAEDLSRVTIPPPPEEATFSVQADTALQPGTEQPAAAQPAAEPEQSTEKQPAAEPEQAQPEQPAAEPELPAEEQPAEDAGSGQQGDESSALPPEEQGQ